MKQLICVMLLITPLYMYIYGESKTSKEIFPIEDSIWHNLTEAKLKKLIKSGIDINAPVYKGQPPLHLALNGQLTLWNPRVAKLLVENKRCNLETKDSDGETALMCAIHNFPSAYLRNVDGTDKIKTDEALGQEELIQLLIKKGANTNVVQSQGLNLLHYASYFQVTPEAMEILIKAGVDVNKKDVSGNTPFFYGHDLTMRTKLLNAGANINSVNRQGETALLFTLNNLSSDDIVSYLIEKGIDLDIKNNEGKTALDLALYGRDFFRKKVDPNNQDDHYYNKMEQYENALQHLLRNRELPAKYFDKRIIGTWQSFNDGSVFTKFDSTGGISILGTNDATGKWSAEGDSVIIQNKMGNVKIRFNIEGDTLTHYSKEDTTKYLRLNKNKEQPLLPLQTLPSAMQYIFNIKEPVLTNFSSAYVANEQDKNKLIDTWQGKSYSVISSDFMFSFYEDGTIKTEGYGNTWSVVGDTLYLREKSGVIYPLQFSIKDEKTICLFDEVNVLELNRISSR